MRVNVYVVGYYFGGYLLGSSGIIEMKFLDVKFSVSADIFGEICVKVFVWILDMFPSVGVWDL